MDHAQDFLSLSANTKRKRDYSEEEDDDLFGSIRRVFTGDDDREPPREIIRERTPYSREREDYGRDRYSGDSRRGERRSRPTYQDNWDDDDDKWL